MRRAGHVHLNLLRSRRSNIGKVCCMVPYLVVFIGAGVGGALRHGVNTLTAGLFGLGFPVGTLTVNVLGSFAMAVIAEYFALKAGLPQPLRLFLTTGILGGFTTFSAFSLDTFALWERGQGLAALGYVAATLVLSFGAFVGGMALVRSLSGSLA
jgi:CrcB protein